MNILIVDDKNSNLKLLRAVLEAEGATVTEATNGIEALDVLERVGVDAVISDILMPRMDGYRLCQEVRASPRSCNVPFIAYSADYTSSGDEKRMIDLGADRIVRKPASPSEFVGILDDVARAKIRRPSQRPRMRSEPSTPHENNARLTARLEEREIDLQAKRNWLTQVEDELFGARAQWQALISMSMNALFATQDEKLVFANSAAVRMLGATAEEELLGQDVSRFLHRDDLATIVAAARLRTEQPGVVRPLLEHEILRFDGSTVAVETNSMRFRYRGQPALLVESRDGSESKRAKSRLVLQRALTEVLTDATSPARIDQEILQAIGRGLEWDVGELWTTDRKAGVIGRTEMWHRSTIEFCEFEAESRTLVDTKEDELVGRVWTSGAAVWCAELSKEAACPRYELAKRMGLRSWFGFPIMLRDKVVGVIGFYNRNVTMPDARLLELFDIIGLQIGHFNAQKQLVKQVRQAEKWEVLCALVSGIAHDFNNILVAIFSCCEMARMEARGNAGLNAHLDGLMEGAQRAASLIRKIPTFISRRQEERRPIQLWRVAAEAVHLLRAAVPSAVDFQASLGKDAPVVLADETQIHRILMNLGINAAHAMRREGGCLKIKLENYIVGPGAAVNPGLRAGRYARFTVRDNGHGMTAETMKGIFEPFVTTKEPGEGTGLGLAIVNEIIKSHEGVITVSSRLNKGTTFRVYLPEYPIAFNETLRVRSRLLLAEGAATRAVGDGVHPQRIRADT